jgi:hypothetical protein
MLPSWVTAKRGEESESEAEDVDTSTATKELTKAFGVPTKKPEGTMPLTHWVLAFEAYSLGAAVVGQWPH